MWSAMLLWLFVCAPTLLCHFYGYGFDMFDAALERLRAVPGRSSWCCHSGTSLQRAKLSFISLNFNFQILKLRRISGWRGWSGCIEVYITLYNCNVNIVVMLFDVYIDMQWLPVSLLRVCALCRWGVHGNTGRSCMLVRHPSTKRDDSFPLVSLPGQSSTCTTASQASAEFYVPEAIHKALTFKSTFWTLNCSSLSICLLLCFAIPNTMQDIQRTSFPCFSFPLSVHVLFLSDVWSFRSWFSYVRIYIWYIYIFVISCFFVICLFVFMTRMITRSIGWIAWNALLQGRGRSPLHCSPSARSCWIPDVMNWGQTPSPFSDPKRASSNSHWHETQRIAAEMAIDYLQTVDVSFHRPLLKYRKWALCCAERNVLGHTKMLNVRWYDMIGHINRYYERTITTWDIWHGTFHNVGHFSNTFWAYRDLFCQS